MVKYFSCNNVEEIVNTLEKLNINFKNESFETPKIESFVPPVKETKWKGWKLSPESIMHTLKYCVEKLALKSELFVIQKGKLESLIHIRPNHSASEYLPRLKNLNKKLKFPIRINFEVVDENFYKRQDLRFMNCIVKPLSAKGQDEPEENRTTLTYYGKMLEEVNKFYDLPDGLYFMTATDNLVLRNDGNEPWIDVVGGKVKLYSHNYKTHIPILNTSTALGYRDIPLPNFDDWDYVKHPDLDVSKIEMEWSKKINKAVFRGGATGCGFTVKSNPRFKASLLSKKYPKLLDAGITTMGLKIKLSEKEGVGYNTWKTTGLTPAPRIPFEEQSKFKYILHLDGNVAAYRLGKTLLLNVVILLQESGSRVWFQHLMKPYVHYVPVKKDLSDLIEKIKWCQKNDELCQRIAENALKLGSQVMTKQSCIDYVASTFWSF